MHVCMCMYKNGKYPSVRILSFETILKYRWPCMTFVGAFYLFFMSNMSFPLIFYKYTCNFSAINIFRSVTDFLGLIPPPHWSVWTCLFDTKKQ